MNTYNDCIAKLDGKKNDWEEGTGWGGYNGTDRRDKTGQ